MISQPRYTQPKLPPIRGDDAALTADIIALATQYGCHGYGESRHCFDGTTGGPTPSGCSGSGGARG